MKNEQKHPRFRGVVTAQEILMDPGKRGWHLVISTGVTPRFLVAGAHTPSSSYSVKQSSRCCYGGIFAEVIKVSNQLAPDRVTWVDLI